MITNINVSAELLDRLKSHLKKGETLNDVIVRLLDLDDEYGSSKLEFEAVFDETVIKVFRLNGNKVEYFTPARRFSISFNDWNLPEEFKEEWINFITSQDIIGVLLGLNESNVIECGCFIVRQI